MSTSSRGLARRSRVLVATALAALASMSFASAAQAEGEFVIGDQSLAPGAPVTFWGAQWWKLNSLSGGTAPASFKGFADNLTGSACASSWTSDPGNSSDPPAAPLPALIEVLVSSTISKAGRTISGDVTAVALVATNPGYEPNPGHAGTGTVVGVLCTVGEEEGGGGPH
jgi:hypothetical protein